MLHHDEMVDKFRVLRLLGKGGMGEVYLARDSVLGRKVALKVVNASHLGSKKSISRFVFEARTTAQFNHPHIVTVFAAGEHQGNPYLALEYLEGQSLRQRLREQRPGLRESLRFILAIADALNEAHQHDILHRDLKPENVFIPRDGRLRVLDFGLAKSIAQGALPSAAEMSLAMDRNQDTILGDEAEEQNTLSDIEPPPSDELNLQTINEIEAPSSSWSDQAKASPPPEQQERRVIVGTPSYIAPEQWSQLDATSASDIWALGVVMFELIAGRRPYMDRDQIALAMKVSSPEVVPALSDFVEVPLEINDLVATCLDKEPDRRLTAGEIKNRIEAMLSQQHKKRSDESSPFRGLQAFGERHAELFFGRDAEIATFLERIREEPVLPIVGPSGAGKSSFVQAGIIPRLREQNDWIVLHMRPGSQPFATLATRLLSGSANTNWSASVIDELSRDRSPRKKDRNRTQQSHASSQALSVSNIGLRKDLLNSPLQLSMVLQQIADESASKVLLFVDQLEELYTLVDDEEVRKRFMRALATAADDPLGPVRVIFTLRDDFLGRLALGPEVREVLSRVTVIRTPQVHVLEEIILKPLQATGYNFDDPGLIPEMVNAVKNEPACLPLLQFASQTLWERRDKKNKLLRRQHYEQMGGVGGALAEHADAVLAGFSPQQLNLARDLLLRLVTAEGTRKVVSHKNLLEGLELGAAEVLERFTSSRLISVRKSRRRRDGGATLELVHESLIRTWSRLARWVDESREDMGFYEELQQATELWMKRKERDEEVWRGGALRDALRFLRRSAQPLSADIQRFLQAGQRRERRTQRRRRMAVVGLALVALISGIMAAAFFEQRNTAKQRSVQLKLQWSEAQREGARAALLNNRLVEARAKLRGSLESQDSTLGRALWSQLKTKALKWSAQLGTEIYKGTISPDGRYAAVAGQDRTIHLFDVLTGGEKVLRGSESQILTVRFSHDGHKLAAGTGSGNIRIWDLGSGQIQVLKGHENIVWSLAFSPDDSLLASASWDKTLRQWNVASGALLRVLKGHKDRVWGVAYSPDGKFLASSSSDKTLRVWNLVESESPLVLRGHHADVTEVHYSPEGDRLISGSADDSLRIWDAHKGKILRVIHARQDRVRTVIFSRDGVSAYSGGADSSVVQWDLRSGSELQRFAAHNGPLSSLSLSRDGKYLLSTASDRTVRLWRTDILKAPDVAQGHKSGALSVAFSPDGQYLASGSYDKTVRIWDVHSGRQIKILRGHEGDIYDLAFSPDGKVLASASYDLSIGLWDPYTGQKLHNLKAHKAGISGVAFRPDGRSLVSSGSDKVLCFWNAQSGTLKRCATGESWLNGVAFSPDGKQVAVASDDNMVNLWDAKKAVKIKGLKGHDSAVVSLAYSPDGRTIISGDDKGILRLWDLKKESSIVLGQHKGRVYSVAFSSDGQRVGSASADGRALLWSLDGRVLHELQGHNKEVNGIAFSPKEHLVATAGDDSTVRLWNSDNGDPFWRGPALLAGQRLFYSHQGWQNFSGQKVSVNRQWMRAVEERALQVEESLDQKNICILDNNDQVEMWSLVDDKALFRVSAAGAKIVLATEQGCALGGDRLTRILNKNGKAMDFPLAASALAYRDNRLFVATGNKIFSFRQDGGPAQSYDSDQGMTALLAGSKWLVVGFQDGSVELIPLHGEKSSSNVVFEGLPSSPVTFLKKGPMGTLLIGFGNGVFGLWQLDSGTQLYRGAHIHGAVRHMVLRQGQLLVNSDLGMHRAMDFAVFDMNRCDLLRQVWNQVPVIWIAGRAMLAAPNPHHPCFNGTIQKTPQESKNIN